MKIWRTPFKSSIVRIPVTMRNTRGIGEDLSDESYHIDEDENLKALGISSSGNYDGGFGMEKNPREPWSNDDEYHKKHLYLHLNVFSCLVP
ncbi:hypothetical protein FRX31_022877 [Thalictrum thalictroides]|uniref:Uncharacterized protein n=1 Tax=Thalictrum thalictroides TaxID=46969 RepID=A0A7J6VR31_THATH|nr:hypothetical protein FRX31_022877 [Thalictrum thalictroides]